MFCCHMGSRAFGAQRAAQLASAGALLSVDDQGHFVYTRGSVLFVLHLLRHVPPLATAFRLVESESSLADELLALTKVNGASTVIGRRHRAGSHRRPGRGHPGYHSIARSRKRRRVLMPHCVMLEG